MNNSKVQSAAPVAVTASIASPLASATVRDAVGLSEAVMAEVGKAEVGRAEDAAAKSEPKASKCYLAYNLTERTRRQLMESFPPRYSRVVAHHIRVWGFSRC